MSAKVKMKKKKQKNIDIIFFEFGTQHIKCTKPIIALQNQKKKE